MRLRGFRSRHTAALAAWFRLAATRIATGASFLLSVASAQKKSAGAKSDRGESEKALLRENVMQKADVSPIVA
jgi:hypothetical protein